MAWLSSYSPIPVFLSATLGSKKDDMAKSQLLLDPLVSSPYNDSFCFSRDQAYFLRLYLYCIYVFHISRILRSHGRFTIFLLGEIGRRACKGASGCRSQSIFDLTHPLNPCTECYMKPGIGEIDHHTRSYVPYSFLPSNYIYLQT